MSARWVPLQCDHEDCLRQAAEKVYMSNPARFEFLCEKHLPAVRINNPAADPERSNR